MIFLKKSRNLKFISQINEPGRWTFLCIWYENRGCRVHETERLDFSLCMAFCIPFLLWQRTSRVYQDHRPRVLTSFVPPVHNQGVSPAPNQGHALWKIFLLTTGSFFILSITDLIGMLAKPAPCGGRFPSLPHTFQPSCHGWIQLLPSLPEAQSNRDRALPVFRSCCLL